MVSIFLFYVNHKALKYIFQINAILRLTSDTVYMYLFVIKKQKTKEWKIHQRYKS